MSTKENSLEQVDKVDFLMIKQKMHYSGSVRRPHLPMNWKHWLGDKHGAFPRPAPVAQGPPKQQSHRIKKKLRT